MLTVSRRFGDFGQRPVILCICVGLSAATGCNSVRYGLPGDVGAEIEQAIVLPPLDLNPRTDHVDAPQPAPLRTAFAASGWMHGFTVDVVDSRGDTVPASVLHHVKVLMPDRRELFMPIALRLLGAGSETRSARVPRSMGIPIEAGDSIIVTAMVHNPTDRYLGGVTIRLRLHYTTAPASSPPDVVYPFFLHVTSPDGPSEYDLPPGYSERSWEARPAAGGHIIALGGHLHRYGLTLRFEDLTTGREIWRTRADVDSRGNVIGVGRRVFTWGRGPRLNPQHAYRVTAAYFNPTGDTIRDGGMGTLGGVFRPDRSSWPRLEPGDPLYVSDLEREVSGHHAAPSGHQHGHGPSHRH